MRELNRFLQSSVAERGGLLPQAQEPTKGRVSMTRPYEWSGSGHPLPQLPSEADWSGSDVIEGAPSSPIIYVQIVASRQHLLHAVSLFSLQHQDPARVISITCRGCIPIMCF